MSDAQGSRSPTRRELMSGAAAVGAGIALSGAVPAAASRRRRRATVAVLGGGVAGLTAAHELAERGFHVTVYEPRALGGKARSIPVSGTAAGGRKNLPGEHGFRFFPGFYQNVPDTMSRIPFPGNPHGVFDNLVSASQDCFSMDGGANLYFPTDLPSLEHPWTVDQVQEILTFALRKAPGIPPDELAFFVRQLLMFFTSSDARRFGQWERTAWWDYIRAEHASDNYRKLLAGGVRDLVAAKAQVASTLTIGLMLEALVYTSLRREGNSQEGHPGYDRLLDGPTNEVWIDPWVAHLRRLGVRFHLGSRVTRLDLRGGRIVAAQLVSAGKRGVGRWVDADWFVLALPVEKARRLWTRSLLKAQPGLGCMADIRTDWMNGIQFYLRRPAPLDNGHMAYVDSPWALTSISQAQFWKKNVAASYGDGRVADILSVDISSWSTRGYVYGRPAWALEPHRIARDVWEQIKAHVNHGDHRPLTDDLVVRWFLDPGISYPARRSGERRIAANADPLLINTVGSWYLRPDAATEIRNLVLASDYVRTDVNLATMEGANEAARRAVNALLDRAGSHAARATVYPMYRPPEWDALKAVDERRYKAGQPHLLDTPWPARPHPG